jgi:uncharacterized peroxidase-related enzyme
LTAAKVDQENQDALLAALETDHRRADLAATDRVLLDYAAKLTASPQKMTATDVQDLRDVGWNDRAIHDVCTIAAYFNFVNRIADGLGVELEKDAD